MQSLSEMGFSQPVHGLLQPGVWLDLAVMSVLLAGRRGGGDENEEQKHANFGLGNEKRKTRG